MPAYGPAWPHAIPNGFENTWALDPGPSTFLLGAIDKPEPRTWTLGRNRPDAWAPQEEGRGSSPPFVVPLFVIIIAIMFASFTMLYFRVFFLYVGLGGVWKQSPNLEVGCVVWGEAGGVFY